MNDSKLPLREAIAKIVGSFPTDEYEATDRIIALFEAQFLDEYGDANIPDDLPIREKIERLAFVVMASPFQLSSRAVASRVLALCGAEQSEGSPSPLGSTLDEARAHRRQNPEYVEAENRIAALARKLAETHGCSETDTDEDVDEFFQQHRDEYEGLAVTALSWLAEQAKGRVFEIDDALADVAIEGIYGADRVRDMKADHDFFYTEYADMRRDQKAAIRAVFDKVGLPFTDAPKNEGVANAK